MIADEPVKKTGGLPKWLYVVAIVGVIGIAGKSARIQQQERDKARNAEIDRRWNQAYPNIDAIKEQAHAAMHPPDEMARMRSETDAMFDDMNRRMDAMREDADRIHNRFLPP